MFFYYPGCQSNPGTNGNSLRALQRAVCIGLTYKERPATALLLSFIYMIYFLVGFLGMVFGEDFYRVVRRSLRRSWKQKR